MVFIVRCLWLTFYGRGLCVMDCGSVLVGNWIICYGMWPIFMGRGSHVMGWAYLIRIAVSEFMAGGLYLKSCRHIFVVWLMLCDRGYDWWIADHIFGRG